MDSRPPKRQRLGTQKHLQTICTPGATPISGRHEAQRSETIPLTLKISLNSSTLKKVSSLNLVIPRVRRLAVRVYSSMLQESLSLFTVPMPMLETLSFNSDSYDGSVNLDDFFAGKTSRLRHLAVGTCRINPESPLFTNLTILELRDPIPRFEAVEFLGVLRKLHCLESLQIFNILEPPEDRYERNVPIPSETKVVDLPSLGFLSYLGTHCLQDLDFLSYLSFPSTTILFFSCGHPVHHDSYLAAVTDFLKIHASACHDFTSFVPTEIRLDGIYGRLELNLSDDEKILCVIRIDSTDGTGGPGYEISDEPDTVEMFSHLQFPTMKSLTTNCYIDPSAWKIISQTFPLLDRIDVDREVYALSRESATILASIVQDYETRDKSSWRPIFPHLKSLSIGHLEILEGYKEHFIGALRKRKAASFGLESISIDQCYDVTEEWVKQLRRVPGLSVEWESSSDSEEEEENEDYDPTNDELDHVDRNYEQGGEIQNIPGFTYRTPERRFDVEENMADDEGDI